MTRSLIEDGSEDFTNIEEHLVKDTRIICRNAVASSLNNVSICKINFLNANCLNLTFYIVLKRASMHLNNNNNNVQNNSNYYQQTKQVAGVRNRRITEQSNMSA